VIALLKFLMHKAQPPTFTFLFEIFIGNVSSNNVQTTEGLPYFRSSQTLYEKFVIKKWVEDSNRYATRQKFIETTNSQWSSMNEEQKQSYLSTIPREQDKKHSLKSYFQTVPKSETTTATSSSPFSSKPKK